MSIGSFILVKGDKIVETMNSLSGVDNIILVTNNSTSESTIKKLKIIMSGCCGSIVKQEDDENYTIKTYSNISWVNINKDYFDLSVILGVLKKYKVVHIGFSGQIFNQDYFDKHVKLLSEETGVVYSDYLNNNNVTYLEYINPNLAQKQKITSVVCKSSILEPEMIKNDDLFSFVIEAYKKNIIRHIAIPLYSQ
jgi:hypothetical protein